MTIFGNMSLFLRDSDISPREANYYWFVIVIYVGWNSLLICIYYHHFSSMYRVLFLWPSFFLPLRTFCGASLIFLSTKSEFLAQFRNPFLNLYIVVSYRYKIVLELFFKKTVTLNHNFEYLTFICIESQEKQSRGLFGSKKKVMTDILSGKI